MPDREKYIECLSKAVKKAKEFNEDIPIKISLVCVEDILELLKEQEAVVRCKDCIHYRYYGLSEETVSECRIDHCENPDADWFCADGERNEMEYE